MEGGHIEVTSLGSRILHRMRGKKKHQCARAHDTNTTTTPYLQRTKHTHKKKNNNTSQECHTRAKHEFLALSGMTWGPSGQGGKQ